MSVDRFSQFGNGDRPIGGTGVNNDTCRVVRCDYGAARKSGTPLLQTNVFVQNFHDETLPR